VKNQLKIQIVDIKSGYLI